MLQDGVKNLAIFFLFIFVTLFIPLLGLFSIFLLPIPFIVFTKNYGYKSGIVLGIIAFLLMFIITPLSLPIIVSFVAGGIVVGELYKRNFKAFPVLLGGALTYIAALILNYIGSIVLLDINPITSIQNVLKESVEISREMFTAIGQEGELALEAAHIFINHLSYIAPTIIIVIGVCYAFITQVISYFVLRWLKESVSFFPPLREWSFPKAFIWYYLFTYLFILFGFEEGSPLHIVLANFSPILECVMIIQGFAFIFYYFFYKKKSTAIPIVLLFVSFVFPILLQIVIILGIIDLGFDLRKRLNGQK